MDVVYFLYKDGVGLRHSCGCVFHQWVFLKKVSYLLWQQKHRIREKMVEALEKQFPEMGLKYSIGKWC